MSFRAGPLRPRATTEATPARGRRSRAGNGETRLGDAALAPPARVGMALRAPLAAAPHFLVGPAPQGQTVRITLPVLLPPATIASARGASASGMRAEINGLILPDAYRSSNALVATGMTSGARRE